MHPVRMTQRTGWLIRRLRRTGWLLRERETRADTVRYLVMNAVGYGHSLGRQAIHRAIASQIGTPRAR